MSQNTVGLEQVYNVIDSRYQSRKPLIATTNLTLEELQHPEDTTHARIYDRLLEMCSPLCFTGENLRKAAAQRKMERLKRLLAGKTSYKKSREKRKENKVKNGQQKKARRKRARRKLRKGSDEVLNDIEQMQRIQMIASEKICQMRNGRVVCRNIRNKGGDFTV